MRAGSSFPKCVARNATRTLCQRSLRDTHAPSDRTCMHSIHPLSSQDIQVFTQSKMLAYRNGKSAGRTADTNWHGPHRFTGNYHVVPVKRACVLHFESCTYEGWRNKARWRSHGDLNRTTSGLRHSPRVAHMFRASHYLLNHTISCSHD